MLSETVQRKFFGRYCTAGGQWYCGLNGVCYSEHCGRYSTAGGQWYGGLNGVCYSEHYVEGTTQQVNIGIVA